jgi:glycosyltransferase involved in cell wall biosynthesis
MKVLLASNMYAYPGNWDKLDALGKLVDLHVITPAAWTGSRELHSVAMVPQHDGGDWVHHRVATITQGNPFRFIYRPVDLVRIMRRIQPEIVHVEQEPESLCLTQFSLLKFLVEYRLLFVAWENVNPLRLGWPMRQLNFRAADGAIFGNQAARDRCHALGFRSRSAMIPQYGFSVVTPDRQIRSQGLALGYAGRLVPEKGVETLIEALDSVGNGVELLVAGDGPLRDRVLGRSRVRWLGNLERTAMENFWGSIDVLILPSLTTRNWAEQFGRVLVEAMARGVVVVGSSSGAIPEVVGDAGLIFAEGDAAALAQTIAQLRSDVVLRQGLIEKGYQRVRNVYRSDIVMRRTVDFYREVLR